MLGRQKLVPLLAVLFGVLLRGVLVMLFRMQSVAVRDLGMMCGLFVMARLVMLGCFAVMLGRMFVVIRGVLVMLMDCVFAHVCPPRLKRALPRAPSQR